MLSFLVLSIVFGLTVFDRGVVGEGLRRALVQAPARLLGRLSRGQIIGLLLVAILMIAGTLAFEVEGLKLMSMAAPELIGWVLLFDVTVVFDLTVLAISLKALAAGRGLTHVATLLRRYAVGLVRRFGTARSRNARRPRRPRPPRTGPDETEPGLAFA